MRARSLKPGFFRNEQLGKLTPLTRLLFEGLWCLADRRGRLEDRPVRIKADILPYDRCDVDKMLQQLADCGEHFIIRYEVNGNQYIQICKFEAHQNPHVKEPESLFPSHSETSTGISGTSTGISGTSHADSPFPISDSLIKPIVELPLDSAAIQEIIDYLNLKTATKYKATSKIVKREVSARLNEGYAVEDFKAVIDKKCEEWIGTEWEKFLRPSTLFSLRHFEEYVNQKIIKPRPKGGALQKLETQRTYTTEEFDKLYKN